MKREVAMTIKIPKELEKDLRVLVVLHGGEIVSSETEEDEQYVEDNIEV